MGDLRVIGWDPIEIDHACSYGNVVEGSDRVSLLRVECTTSWESKSG